MSSFNELSEGVFRETLLDGMRTQMQREGKAESTICKYLRDARGFLEFIIAGKGGEKTCIDQDTIKEYRDYLSSRYKVSSINSMIAGANYLLRYCGRDELTLRACRLQKDAFRNDEFDLTLEEYRRLLDVAAEGGKSRLCMIMMTLGSTGMRVSELPFITVEALDRRTAIVSLKGKTRQVIIPESLCSLLKNYSDSKEIKSGSIFITRSGRPVDRTNILHDMKKLCGKANVDPRKVHPHNFRHLFALTYYDRYRDIVHLADILGHSNINTTRIYTAVPRGELTKNIERLGLISH